jgi:hypothetical protein
MNKHTGHDCPPSVHPADQPKPPGDKGKCADLPKTEQPPLKDPVPCPEPPKCCKCPPKPTSNCLEDLITSQPVEPPAEDRAKFKKELSALLDSAKTASQAYNKDKYDELLDKWLKLDADIADFVRKLECGVWCWHCILDCYVCPLLNQLHDAEKRLYDDGDLPTDIHSLYDLQYWLIRDRDKKVGRLTRIKNVLKAWETPATTIDKVLNDNKTLLDGLKSLIGSQPGKVIYDLFFRLIPLHLAIAPPKGDKTTTKIDKKYTEFCDCDTGTPDDCCGPDVGERSLRQRLIPANEQLTKADEALTKVNNDIERFKKAVGDGWQAEFEKNAKAAIPSVIDCCEYENHDDDDQQQQQQQQQQQHGY